MHWKVVTAHAFAFCKIWLWKDAHTAHMNAFVEKNAWTTLANPTSFSVRLTFIALPALPEIRKLCFPIKKHWRNEDIGKIKVRCKTLMFICYILICTYSIWISDWLRLQWWNICNKETSRHIITFTTASICMLR